MNALPLDAMGYSGTYKLVGGRPAFDLVNTISWPGTDSEHDWLTTGSNIQIWLGAVGLGETALDGAALSEFRSVRDSLSAVLGPVCAGRRPRPAGTEAFNGLLTHVLGRRRIDPVQLIWTWEDPARAIDLLDPVVLDAAEILTGDHARLKHCPSCGWLFEDQTRNGGRRWCDMADCGSRAKSNSYYRRHKGTAS